MNRILTGILLALIVIAASAKEAPQEILKMKHVHFFGGPGDARETAVIIEGAKSQTQGMEAEYFFISQKYGQKDKAWKLVGQTLERDEGRVFDTIEIEQKKDGSHTFLYFDLTQCSWVSKKPAP